MPYGRSHPMLAFQKPEEIAPISKLRLLFTFASAFVFNRRMGDSKRGRTC
jgi:hypothetical protein